MRNFGFFLRLLNFVFKAFKILFNLISRFVVGGVFKMLINFFFQHLLFLVKLFNLSVKLSLGYEIYHKTKKAKLPPPELLDYVELDETYCYCCWEENWWKRNNEVSIRVLHLSNIKLLTPTRKVISMYVSLAFIWHEECKEYNL